MKIRKKKEIDLDVYSAAIKRVEYAYELFDSIVVSFSAGKDSTAVLHIAYEVAKKLDRLPLQVVFFDEEAIYPPTYEYAERIRQNPDFDFKYYCLPIKHRNACSNEHPYWFPWNPEKKDLWVRELPDNVITEHPAFQMGDTMPDAVRKMVNHDFQGKGTCGMMMGIRTQESLRRYRLIASKKNDQFISRFGQGHFNVFPIYDWSSEDVWRLVDKKGIDYNTSYDLMNKTDMHNKLLKQRVSNAYGEQPIRGLYIYQECWPDLFEKMLHRVPGVATAVRYANTELWLKSVHKPEGKTWRQYTDILIKGFDGKYQKMVKKNLNKLINSHYEITTIKIQDEEAHPITGVSWKSLAELVKKGDFKGRYSEQIKIQGERVRDKMGITLKEALLRYCKPEFASEKIKFHNL
jgi:predicted phosphoadenosine phosphosulfate sulfurtransferase